MERSTALVIDASIAVKWFVPESDSKEALEIRDAHVNEEISIIAPDLITYEVANALRYRSSLTNENLKTSIESLFGLELDLIAPSSNSVSRTALLARRFGITIYDATYLTLAQDLDCELLTTDKTFYNRVIAGLDDDDSKRIILLTDYFQLLGKSETAEASSAKEDDDSKVT